VITLRRMLIGIGVAGATVGMGCQSAPPTDQSRLQDCQANLVRIGTACKLYATDHGGHYPGQLPDLVPAYLKSIPTCPASGRDTYSSGFHSAAHPDLFTITCSGGHPR
jgi:hypothetical protein